MVLQDEVWNASYPFPPDYLAPLSRYDIIGYCVPKYKPEPDLEACPGEGKCHGCICWCDWCGDVNDVCDAEWPGCCDTHERYPEQPEHLKPNPNQLFLPGFVPTTGLQTV